MTGAMAETPLLRMDYFGTLEWATDLLLGPKQRKLTEYEWRLAVRIVQELHGNWNVHPDGPHACQDVSADGRCGIHAVLPQEESGSFQMLLELLRILETETGDWVEELLQAVYDGYVQSHLAVDLDTVDLESFCLQFKEDISELVAGAAPNYDGGLYQLLSILMGCVRTVRVRVRVACARCACAAPCTRQQEERLHTCLPPAGSRSQSTASQTWAWATQRWQKKCYVMSRLVLPLVVKLAC